MRKPYEELEFTDNFMFVNVLTYYPELCRELLELILKTPIREVRILENEHSIELSYEAKGIRADIFTEDDENTVYDIEMQVSTEPELPKRSRYYHSAIDMEQLDKGSKYKELRKTYVIFICKTSAGKGYRKPIYTFRYRADEEPEKYLEDGSYTVIVNAECDDSGLSDEMKKFLHYIRTGKAEENDVTFAGRLNKVVTEAIKSRKWSKKYMIWANELEYSYEKGLEEGRQENKEALDQANEDLENEKKRADAAEREIERLKAILRNLEK